MDLRVYEALFRFNQGMDQTLESLNFIEKLELGSPESVSRVRTSLSELRSYANNCFASKIAQRDRRKRTISSAFGGTARRPRRVPMRFTSNWNPAKRFGGNRVCRRGL
jgi:hypothetical protein